MNDTNLLIIDSRIQDLDEIILSVKESNKFIILDYYNDTFITLTAKIEDIGVSDINSIGLLRHGYIFPTYKLLDSQQIPSIVFDVENKDPNIISWNDIKNFLLYLIYNFSLKNFDFLSCRLDKNSNYQYIFNKLELKLNINIRAPADDLGNLQYGGTWFSGFENIQSLYFNEKIFDYPYLFYSPVLTIEANSYIKNYDLLPYTTPYVTYDGFINNDTISSLIGTLKFRGTYLNAVNVGTYTIEPFGFSSSSYYINYINGSLVINSVDLVISVLNYIKTYDGTNLLTNYDVNYNGLLINDIKSLSGTLTISGSHVKGVNVGAYSIIPYGITSFNYNVIFQTTTLTIIPQTLLIIANNYSKVYDKIPFYGGNGINYNGFVNGENELYLSGTLYYTGTSQGAIDAGVYTITPNGLFSQNYNILFVSASLTIYTDIFLIASNNFRKFYDSLLFTNPSISYTNDIYDLSGNLIFNGSFLTAKDANTYTISINGLTSNNYVLYYYDGELIIDKAEVKVIAIDDSVNYTATPYNKIQVTFKGFLGTDTSNIFTGTLTNVGTSLNAVNAGVYNIIPSGLSAINYYVINQEGTLIINKAPIYIVTQLYTKVYDGTTQINNINLISNIIIGLSGIFNNENIKIISYDAKFKNHNSGYQLIDISNLTLSGFTSSNYYISPISPITGLILKKPINSYFNYTQKAYDTTDVVYGLIGTLSGIIGNDIVTYLSAEAKFRNFSPGIQLIDVSNIYLAGDQSNNYIVYAVNPIYGLIFQKNIEIIFNGGQKIYDSTIIPGPITYVINGDLSYEPNLSLSSYVALFRSKNTGNQYIDISNIILKSKNSYAYIIAPILPIYSNIYPNYLRINFFGGSKIYDSTIFTGSMTYTISGIFNNDIVNVSTYNSFFNNPTIGFNRIDISNVILNGIDSLNYLINPIIPIYANIYLRELILTFHNAFKTYDSDINGGDNIYGTISGLVRNENVTISSFIAIFRDPNAGLVLIDISNIILNGPTSFNYYIKDVPPILGQIYPKELFAVFIGGEKIYDGTYDTGPLYWSLSGKVYFDIITISSYISKFKDPNSGPVLIDVSNIILSSFNYYVAEPPFLSYIYKKDVVAKFFGGDKNYDGTNNTGQLYWSLSGFIGNEILTISTYISRFKDPNIGYQLIDISDIVLAGLTYNNYYVVAVSPITAFISQKRLKLNFFNGSKIYDANRNVGDGIYVTISGVIENEIVTISSFIAIFRDSNAGLVYIDISDVILDGPNSYNYSMKSVPPVLREIYQKAIDATILGGEKIYDGTTNTGQFYWSLSGQVADEIITISSYISKFKDPNIGPKLIDVSNIMLSSLNYYVIAEPPFLSYIYKKDVTANIFGGDKMYDSTTDTGPIYWSLSGVVVNEILTISYLTRFRDPNSGYQIIDISDVILSGLTYNNYNLITVSQITAFISQKRLKLNFFNGSKIYDANRNVGDGIYVTISGVIENEIVTISSFIAIFRDSNAGLVYIDISDVILDGPNSYNYSMKSVPPVLREIYQKAIDATILGGEKIYDGTTNTGQFYWSLSGQVADEIITISSYISKFKDPNIGPKLIDVSNIMLSSLNYYVIAEPPFLSYIYKKDVIANIFGGDKMYDSTTDTGPTYWSLSGVVVNEILTISYLTRFRDPNSGYQIIDISDIILAGLTYTNYNLIPVSQITALITQKRLILNFFNGSKIYDSNRNVGDSIYMTISGIIGNDIITISSFIAKFRDPNAGLVFIDISDVILNGPNSYNYSIKSVPPVLRQIYQKAIIAIFTGGEKIYDGTTNTGPLYWSLSGQLANQIITISSYISKFKNPSGGPQLIDVSNIILSSLNYFVKQPPFLSYIYKKNIIANFFGGDKMYDSNNNTGPTYWSLSGIIENDMLTISTYITRFKNPNTGYQLIDISNIILAGLNLTNYNFFAVPPITAFISPKELILTIYNGSKIYDSYRNAGNDIYGTLSGIIGSENVTISSFIGTFKDPNVGLVLIDISNIILKGPNSFNYSVKSVPPVLRQIYQKALIAKFTGGEKIYDSTNNTGPIYWSLSGQVSNEIITISTYVSRFKNPNFGPVLIDVSNIILSSLNYFVTQPPFLSYIYKKNIIATFFGGDKKYDGTNNTGLTYWSLSGMIGTEIISISNYNTRFKNPNTGYQLIDISNILLAGLTYTNYNVIPVPPITAFISQKEVVLTFYNGSKIYNSNRNAGNDIYGTISGIIGNEIVTISSFIGTFKDPNVGLVLIDISNIILKGPTSFNYIIKAVPPILRQIYQKALIAKFTGGEKIYDSTNNTGPIYWSLSGQVANEIITISTYISRFKNPNAGPVTIDVSNIIIEGINWTNYYVISIPFTSYIYKKNVVASFFGGDKIYDSTNNTGPTYWSLSGMIGTEIILISTYNTSFKNPNTGYQLIDISNIILAGLTYTNYNVIPVPPITAFISQKEVVLTFYNGSKIYDSLRNAGNDLYGTISGIIGNENVTISSFIGTFKDPNTGIVLIDISNIILKGPTSFNYFIKPVPPLLATIYLRSLIVNFFGGSKIYNKQLNTGEITISLSGIVTNEYIFVKSFNSQFSNFNAGLNSIIVTNILLAGDTSNNYIAPIPNYSAIIYQKPIMINSLIKNKLYDSTSVVNLTFSPYLTNIEVGDAVSLLSYTANFASKNAGENTIDISNIVIFGNNFPNYKSNFKISISGYINYRILTITFGGLNKIYDGIRNAYNLSYIITNNLDPITITYYDANFKSQNIGSGIIDISNVTLSGSAVNNYFLLPILSSSGTITIRNLFPTFSGGTKIYDKTIITGPLTYSIINIANNENIDIASYTSQFNSSQVGQRRIDISNIILTGSTLNNYNIIPTPPIYTTINKKPAGFGIANSIKIYDALTNLGPNYYGYFTNIIEGDNILFLNLLGVYTDVNCGNNVPINATTYSIGGSDSGNYSFTFLSSSGIITPKGMTLSFTGGTKKYDTTYNTGTISGIFSGILSGDNITLNSYTSKFRSNQTGFQLIDVSNVTFSGSDANNYYATNNLSFLSRIFPADTYALFNVGNKTYDGTNIVYDASGTLYNVYLNDNLLIQSFNAKYITPNSGYNRVDISNVILGGSDVINYNLLPVTPAYSTIYGSNVFIYIYGGDKIYDKTNLTGPFNLVSLSGTLENIKIISFKSTYTNINYGYQLITISNLVFSSSAINNYNITILPVYGFISPKPITVSFFNINKIYDKTNNILNTISASLNSVIENDNIYITSFTGRYKNYLVGNTQLDISNIVINGTSINNYTIINQPPLNAQIIQRPTNALFYGGNKRYDGTNTVSELQYILTNIIESDNVIIQSYNAIFDNIYVGTRNIIFSNPILSGSDSNNYSIQPVISISAIIFKKLCEVTFTVNNKIYDNNNIAYLRNPILSNIILNDISGVFVYSYLSTYDTIYVGINKSVTVTDITLSGSKSQNYDLLNKTIYLFGVIESKLILTKPIVMTKIYDQNTIAYLSNITLSGVYTSDINYINVFNYNSFYNDNLVGINKTVTVNNITLSGLLAYNYYTIPITTLGNINKKELFITFTGVDKGFDNNTNATVINPVINGIISEDVVYLLSYNSNFINRDVGINKVILVNNIVLTGASSINYISISSYTQANILTNTQTTLTIPNTNSTYQDISNNIIVSFGQIFERQTLNFTNTVVGINDLYAFLRNGFIFNGLTYQNIDGIINNISYNNQSSYIISSISGTIYISNNNFNTINKINLGIIQNIINSTQIYINTGFLITSNQIYKTINGGNQWFNIYTDISNQFTNITSIDASNIFIIGSYGLILTTKNGGISWSYKNLINQKFNSIIMYDLFSGFIVGNNGIIYKTLDGNNWTSTTYSTNNFNSIYSINKNDVIVVGDNGIIIRSSTRGVNWFSLISGTTENLVSIYSSNTNNIRIGGTNGLVLNYILTPSGLLSVFDNNNILFTQPVNTTNSQFIFSFTDYSVKRYFISASFLPFRPDFYTASSTNTILLIIKPKLIYSNTITQLLFDNIVPTYSEIPFYDQSGGTFTIIDSVGNLVSTQKAIINNSGQIIFDTNIPVNRYTIIPIYSLNNTSNQVSYRINVLPNIIYENSQISILYLQTQTISRPYVNPQNGFFTISDSIGSLVKNGNAIINTISGIITIFNTAPISNNIINVIYTFNNLSNLFALNFIINSIITYSVGIINLEYLTGGTSETPFVNPTGGIFTISDISGNLAFSNRVTIGITGIINFSNNIPVGFYNFNVSYNIRGIIQKTQYKLNAMPTFRYRENTKIIDYDRPITDSSSIPIVLPLGGYFIFKDLSGGLISKNYITTDYNTGKIFYLDNTYPDNYSLFITYYNNLAYKSLIYNVIVKPSIKYEPPFLTIIYNTVTKSKAPNAVPLGGTFIITELDNILYQTKFIDISATSGMIYVNTNLISTINVGIYNFRIFYTVNGNTNNNTFTLNVTPLFYYSINTFYLGFDNSGTSISAFVYPVGGNFSISGFIINKIKINQINGVLTFDRFMNPDNYIIPILYTINKLETQFLYYLTVFPTIFYNSLTQLYEQTTTQYSQKPYVNPQNGLFLLFDVSNSYVSIDTSGIVAIQPNINVGIYNFNIRYLINNIISNTIFNLIVKPNLIIINDYIELQYTRQFIYYSEKPYVNQQNGIFTLKDIVGNLKSNGFSNINANTGIITINTGTLVGTYILQTIYTLNNSYNTVNTTIVIKPEYYYSISSIIINYGLTSGTNRPNTFPNGGIFNVYDTSFNLTNYANTSFVVNENTGIVFVNNDIDVGKYIFLINYLVNEIKTIGYFNLLVIPNLIYYVNQKTILYNTSTISTAPDYSQKSGLFTIFDFSNNFVLNNLVTIDTSGIIYFDKGINVGKNLFIINYNLNNVANQTTYTLNVLPIVNYIPSTNYLLYERNGVTYSLTPIYEQLNGFFTIKDYIGELVLNKSVKIDISTGIIAFNDLISVDNYSFVIFYTLNNLQNTTIYNLVIQPNLNYSVGTLNIFYGLGGQSEKPYANPTNGIFAIYDTSGSSIVSQYLVRINNNSGVIFVSENIPVGTYQVNVIFTVNGNSSNFIYNIVIPPNLSYRINTKIIDYGLSTTSVLPIINPTKGVFTLSYVNSLSGKVLINQNNGQISFSNGIDVGYYIILVNYTYNYTTTTVNYYLTINPVLIYTQTSQTIVYNHDLTYSESPVYYQKYGTFQLLDISNTVIQNNLVTVDSSGVINFKNYINIGNYGFIVQYTLNSISISVFYTLFVIPNISYSNNNNYILYKDSYDSGIPYVDPSGGIFIFSDISGDMISNNLINTNNLTGIITITNSVNVGFYTLLVTYIINDVENSTELILNIIPIIQYTIGVGSKVYSSVVYSEIPFVDQAGGIFYTDGYTGLIIDTSNGKIKFNYDLNVDNYNFNIYYKLNGVTNVFTYKYLVYPLIDYDSLFLNTVYDTSISTNNAFNDPPGGYFYLTTIDLSNSIVQNYFDISYIKISQETGKVDFDKNIEVGKYYIVVNYIFNNILNSVMLTYIMKPYMLYPIGNLRTLYHDISYSELPIGQPYGGYYDATVPRISLIYTGISIDHVTGIIRFGFVNAGYWVLTCSYTYNNVTTTQSYYLFIIAGIYYTPPYEIIPYNSVFTTDKPFEEVPGGTYSLVETISGFSINAIDGKLKFSNLDAGVYYVGLRYLLFESEIVINYTLVVKPTVNYIPNYIQMTYTNPINSVYPIYIPLGGIFYLQNSDPNNPNVSKDIKIDISNGLIQTNSLLKVSLYNILVNYLVNSSTETVPFTVSVYPNFTYPIGFLNITYGSNYYSELAQVNPNRGIYTSIDPNFSIDTSGGRLFISNINSVGKYILPIQYTFNDMSVIYNYRLIINPLLKYSNTNYLSIYGNSFKSDVPTAKEYNGTFIIKLVNSTFPLGIGYNSTNIDIYDDYKLIFNPLSGILYFGSKIKVGFYNFNIKYIITDLSSNVNFNYTVLPNVYFTPNSLELGYQTVGTTKIPFRDQSGGFFSFSNTNDFINQIGKINLNNKTGVISFYKGIDVGLYNFKLNYKLNNISNITNFYLNIKPIFYYLNDTKTLIYDSSGYSDFPYVLTGGGRFYLYDISGQKSENFDINLYSGVIFINKLFVGNYTITLKYVYNSSFTLTNYNIVVIPYINYPIGRKTISYSDMDNSEIPIGLETGGVWSFYNLDDYGIQSSKLYINSSSGIIYFNSYINSGIYNTYISYTVKNLSNIFNYILNVDPYLSYDISNSINLLYNSQIIDTNKNIIYKTNEPIISPIGGIFCFKDNSNNLIQNNIEINKYTGQIFIYNKPKVNSYTYIPEYYIKNLKTSYPIKINIYPNFNYSNKNIIIYYNTNNTFTQTTIPYYDPSGGVFKFVNPIDFNLFNKTEIKSNGQIVFNNNIIIGNYNLGINYIKTNISTFLFNVYVFATVTYKTNVLNILYNNEGYSLLPTVIPYGGVFDISNNIYNQNINSTTGLLNFSGLEIGSYTFVINYLYNNVTTKVFYYVNVLSLISYNPSIKIENYSFGGTTNSPYVDLTGGLFTIPYNFINYNISIDSSNGIIKFKNNTPIFDYNIPVSYSVNNLSKSVIFNLIIQPYIYYDISSIILNYNNSYITKSPFINPKSGLFEVKVYDNYLNYVPTNKISITVSGIIIINDVDVSSYIISSRYKYANVQSTYNIYLIVKPIFYYSIINKVVYKQNNYSTIPFTNPNNGLFTSLNINIGNVVNDGIIKFNEELDVSNYIIPIEYTKNFISTVYNYNFNVVPYINYNQNNTQHIGKTTFTTISAIVLPIDGYFYLQNNSNPSIQIDNLGNIYFDTNVNVNIYNINVAYKYNNLINTFTYTHSVLPSIYYDDDKFNYGLENYSKRPITNTNNAYFSIEFIPEKFIQIDSITIDSSSGIIKFKDDLVVGSNSFYVIITKNSLTNIHLYKFIVNPNIQYENSYVLNYGNTISILPILYNPLFGTFILFSNYNFITLKNEYTGEITINGTEIGLFNFNIVYSITDASNISNILVQINPIIKYPQNYEFTYGNISSTDQPIVSVDGGKFYNYQNFYNINLDNDTGIISINNLTDISSYNMNIYYVLYDISSYTTVNITVKPYIFYNEDLYIEYGINGFTNTPIINPINGIFNLIDSIDGITINPNNGSINISSIVKKNNYILNVKYIYNGVMTIAPCKVFVLSKTIELTFVIKDKIYDGTSNLKVESNKLTGVINNDKVFVLSYNASFLSPDVALDSPVNVTDIELGGPDLDNYYVNPDLNTVGNIEYANYNPNIIKINKGTIGNSPKPNISDTLNNPSFIIKQPVNGLGIDDFGIIYWSDILNSKTYNIQVLVFDAQQSLTIDFTLIVTNNLYSLPISVDLPNIDDNVLEYKTYQLKYTSISGFAYAVDSETPSAIAKFDIKSYINGNLNHDLQNPVTFTFELPNADPTTELIISELNDNNSINPKYQYYMTYIGNNLWLANLRYLSDFYVQDANTKNNTPPTISPTNNFGNLFYGSINVTITALPGSTIYYTLNNTDPTVDSNLYTVPFLITEKCKVKAISFTPGYLPSTITEVLYNIVPIPCILSNSLIKTPEGYEFVDNLKVDDLIVTSDGRTVPIVNILKYEIIKPKNNEYPVIIPKDFFGSNLPNKETYLSETHAILLPDTTNEWMIPSDNITLFKRMNTKIVYYNFELPNYFTDNIVINNLPIESWSAGKFRYKYSNKIQKIINKRKLLTMNKYKI